MLRLYLLRDSLFRSFYLFKLATERKKRFERSIVSALEKVSASVRVAVSSEGAVQVLRSSLASKLTLMKAVYSAGQSTFSTGEPVKSTRRC